MTFSSRDRGGEAWGGKLVGNRFRSSSLSTLGYRPLGDTVAKRTQVTTEAFSGP